MKENTSSAQEEEYYGLPYHVVAHSVMVWFVLLAPARNSSQTPPLCQAFLLPFKKALTKVGAQAGWWRHLCRPSLPSPRGWAMGPCPARRGEEGMAPHSPSPGLCCSQWHRGLTGSLCYLRTLSGARTVPRGSRTA